MRVVADQFEILELEIVDVLHRRIQLHLRQRARLAGELQLRLFEVIGVEVQVAEGVDECAWLQIRRPARPSSSAARSEAMLNGTPRNRSALRW